MYPCLDECKNYFMYSGIFLDPTHSHVINARTNNILVLVRHLMYVLHIYYNTHILGEVDSPCVRLVLVSVTLPVDA